MNTDDVNRFPSSERLDKRESMYKTPATPVSRLGKRRSRLTKSVIRLGKTEDCVYYYSYSYNIVDLENLIRHVRPVLAQSQSTNTNRIIVAVGSGPS